MKKTLIALAVLAASGASFAQVSVTGAIAMGYMQTTAGSGATASGFGVDTAELNFNASEDLGGGSKVSGKIQFDTVSRGGVTGGDVLLAYTSGTAGTLTLANAKGADYLTGGIAAVGNKGLDGAITSARGLNDAVSYSYPLTSALTLGLSHVEAAKSGTLAGTSNLGLGKGAAGEDVGEQRRNMIEATYKAGALVANLGTGSYDSYGAVTTSFKSITRGAVSYDLGMVKLGAGFDSRTMVVGTRMDAVAGFMVPVGAFSAGMLFGSRSVNDVSATADGTRTGYSARAQYAFSKLTNVTFDYQSYKAALTDSSNANMAEIYLTKAF